MKTQEKIERAFLYVVLVCYMFFLLKLLFLSRVSFGELFNSQRNLDRSINLIPFSSIRQYIFGSDTEVKRFAFSNMFGNIAIFVPLGTYLTLLNKDKRLIRNLSVIFLGSLLVEIIQGLLGIGTSDIDDIILNCLGGLTGVLGYKLLLYVLRDNRRVHTAITIISALGLPRLLYFTFVIRLRL